MASCEHCGGASAVVVCRSASRLTLPTRRLRHEPSIGSSQASGGRNRGIPRVGSIAPRAAESLYARFFPGAKTSTLLRALVAAPLGLPPKKGTESKPRNKKNDLRQLMGSDIFADRLMCHFP